MEVINDSEFLGILFTPRVDILHLFRINYEHWEIQIQASKDLDNIRQPDLITNDLDRRTFMIYQSGRRRIILPDQPEQALV